MINASSCNSFHGIGLMDFAYLALHVYRDPVDLKALGHRRPYEINSLDQLHANMHKNCWFHLNLRGLSIPKKHGFYAELYAKIYHGRIQHLMVAFRGTVPLILDTVIEDIKTWLPAILPGTDHGLPTPSYWHQAANFLMKSNQLIRQLDHLNLLAPICGQHITGHSLGGALANLVAAKAFICKPPGLRSQLPITPNVISFNAPGISMMPGVCSSQYCEGQVISMRADFDFVSAIGQPYGYVVNNYLPEGYATSKEAFAIQHQQEHFEEYSTLLSAQAVIAPQVAGVVKTYEVVERIKEGYEARDIFHQHSMNNFLTMIKANDASLSTSFQQIKNWAIKHGGKNHNLKGPDMLGTNKAAMAV